MPDLNALLIVFQLYEKPMKIRVCAGYCATKTTDRNGTDEARAGIAENIRFAKEVDDIRASGKSLLSMPPSAPMRALH